MAEKERCRIFVTDNQQLRTLVYNCALHFTFSHVLSLKYHTNEVDMNRPSSAEVLFETVEWSARLKARARDGK